MSDDPRDKAAALAEGMEAAGALIESRRLPTSGATWKRRRRRSRLRRRRSPPGPPTWRRKSGPVPKPSARSRISGRRSPASNSGTPTSNSA